MRGWFAFERGWRDALLISTLPAFEPARAAAFWAELERAAPPILRLGLRVAVWALTLSPPFLARRLCLFRSLDAAERDRLLVRAAASRVFLLRQLVLTLKLVVCFGHLHDPSVRAALDEPSR